MLDQTNTENALAEEIRQFNESMAFEREQFEYQKEQAAARSSGGGGGGGGGYSRSSGGSSSNTAQISGDKATSGISSLTSSTKATQASLINGMIANGATKDDVANTISRGVTNGTITKAEAASLRETFTPRGYTY